MKDGKHVNKQKNVWRLTMLYFLLLPVIAIAMVGIAVFYRNNGVVLDLVKYAAGLISTLISPLINPVLKTLAEKVWQRHSANKNDTATTKSVL